jgi:uncharacterized protein
VKFWDTSAIIPLLVDEGSTKGVEELYVQDPLIVVWWGTSIECVSALSRLERESKLSTAEAEQIVQRLAALRATWREVQPSDRLKAIADRILRLHPLRAQDAQQLAACIVVSQEHGLEFVTLDERLAAAGRKEGLLVPPPSRL